MLVFDTREFAFRGVAISVVPSTAILNCELAEIIIASAKRSLPTMAMLSEGLVIRTTIHNSFGSLRKLSGLKFQILFMILPSMILPSLPFSVLFAFSVVKSGRPSWLRLRCSVIPTKLNASCRTNARDCKR